MLILLKIGYASKNNTNRRDKMELKQLQMEILEAERLIERNKMIMALNEQSIALKKENDELKSNVAETVAGV